MCLLETPAYNCAAARAFAFNLLTNDGVQPLRQTLDSRNP